MLALSLEKLAFLIEKSREFDAEVPANAGDSDDSPADDLESGILQDTRDNPTTRELRDAINGLNEDEQHELLALTFVGRGDFEASEWKLALQTARETITSKEADYLIGTPLLADYLEAAADALELPMEEFQANRL